MLSSAIRLPDDLAFRPGEEYHHYMSQKVDSIRQKIESIDDRIHDLLMERAALSVEIHEEKRKSTLPLLQPDRDIAMIRRILERHKGSLPKEALVRIWRELAGAVSLLRSGHKIVVSMPDGYAGSVYWDMAKDYFSSVVPMQKVANPLAALAQVREDESVFAVLPWPENDQPNAWWTYLPGEQREEDGMRIVARLPLGDSVTAIPNPEHRALVVGRLKFSETGADRSFLALDLDEDISRTKIIDKAKSMGKTALGLYSCSALSPGRKIHLLEVEGYIAPDWPESSVLERLFDDPGAQCLSVGGYPVPPVYDERTEKKALSSNLVALNHIKKSA